MGAGASIPPQAMMHFPLFQIFPLFPKHFLTPLKISQNLPFLEKFSDFHPSTFLMTLFVINHKFQIHFPQFQQNYSFPHTFQISPPVFSKFACFYILFIFFVSSLYTFTMMHLCITQCTYWTPLNGGSF